MTEIIEAHLYDYPKYYDLVYGSDWKAEFDFLKQCFEKHAAGEVERLFEPACGTGRLLIKLAEAGYKVAGNDLNPNAIDFCNARLQRRGFPPSAFVGDMSDFSVKRKFDAAFNMINSFRHLPTERSAENHLRCMADALVKGGLYILGLHMTPTVGESVDREAWSARRGNLSVVSTLWSENIDLEERNERVGMTFDVYTPTRHVRIVDEMGYRIYTAKHMHNLFSKVPELEIAEIYDFSYDIDEPVTLGPRTEDVVFVLQKK